MLHPINTQTTFRRRKVGGISVKWRNCLKREGIGRQSPTTYCFLVKYIMLFRRSTEDRVLPSVSWIRILSGIWKRAWNSRLDRTPIRRSSLRCLALAFFHPLFWGLPLVEMTISLAIRLSGSGSCRNLRGSTQLLESITRLIRHSTLPQQYKKSLDGP